MEIVAKSKYLEFKSAKSPSGDDWYYVKRTNDKSNNDSAVVITTLVKINNTYHFLFLKTKRPPLYSENKSEYCLESPAGLIADENPDESLLNCIKKELMEEAGIKADNIFIELKNSSTSSGLSSETVTYATAVCNNYKIINKPESDGGIISDRILVSVNKLDDFINNIDNNISIASATVAGIYFAKNRLISFTTSES